MNWDQSTIVVAILIVVLALAIVWYIAEAIRMTRAERKANQDYLFNRDTRRIR